MVRTLACHARGRRFEPVPGRHFRFIARNASVAQLVEQWTENPRVAGSIPAGGTKYADVAHLVERHLAKVEVASSSLVIRSIRYHSQVVRPRSAKPLFPGSNPGGTSKNSKSSDLEFFYPSRRLGISSRASVYNIAVGAYHQPKAVLPAA